MSDRSPDLNRLSMQIPAEVVHRVLNDLLLHFDRKHIEVKASMDDSQFWDFYVQVEWTSSYWTPDEIDFDAVKAMVTRWHSEFGPLQIAYGSMWCGDESSYIYGFHHFEHVDTNFCREQP